MYKITREKFFVHFEESAFYRPSRKGAIPGHVLLFQARAEEAGFGKGPLLELLLVVTTAVESIGLWIPFSALLLALIQLDRRAALCAIPFFSLELLLSHYSVVLGAAGSCYPACCQEQDPWTVMLA